MSDYSESGINKTTCQGYVISLTDTFSEPFLVKEENGTINVLPWGSESVNNDVFTIPIEQKINEWSGYYNHHKIIEYAEDEKNGLTLKDFPAAYTCEYYGKYTLGTDENGEPIWVSEDSSTGLEAPDNTSGWFLPTVHMLYSVSGREGFRIGGKEYFTDKEGYAAIDKLFNDRIEHIKKYLGQDPLYNEGFCNYIGLAKGTFETFYWGVNHYTVAPSITSIKGISYNYYLKNGSKSKSTGGVTTYEFHDFRARPFLAF